MRLTDTLLLYAMIGVSCGIIFLRQTHTSRWWHGIRVALSVAFWPLMLPLLFVGQRETVSSSMSERERLWRQSERGAACHRMMRHILETMSQSQPMGQGSLMREREALWMVISRLQALDERASELQKILQKPEFEESHALQVWQEREKLGNTVTVESARIHLENVQQLMQLHQQIRVQFDELWSLLERVHSQVTVLRFAGPVSSSHEDREELLALIEGWKDSTSWPT